MTIKKFTVGSIMTFAFITIVALVVPIKANAATETTNFSGRLDNHTGICPSKIDVSAYSPDGHTHHIMPGDWINKREGMVSYPLTIAFKVNNGVTYGPVMSAKINNVSCYSTAPTININFDTSNWHNTYPNFNVTAKNDAGSSTSNNSGWNKSVGNGMSIYIAYNKSMSYDKVTQNAPPAFYIDNQKLIYASVKNWAGYSRNSVFTELHNYNYAIFTWNSNNINVGSLHDGVNNINIVACDNYGNISAREYTYKYDATSPYANNVEIKNITSNGYDVYVYGVGDKTSGVQTVKFPTWSLVGQGDLRWDEGKNIGNGTWYYHVDKKNFGNRLDGYGTDVYVYDNAGNKAKFVGCAWLKLDNTAPSMIFDPYSMNWTNQDITVKMTPIDTESGVDYFNYRYTANNGSSWSNWSSNIYNGAAGYVTFSDTGIYNIQTCLIDKVGNSGYAYSGWYYIDKVIPTVNIVTNPDTPDGSNGWYNSYTAPVITFNAADSGGSGLKSVSYDVTGADTKSAVETSNGGIYALYKEGIYNFTETAIDNAGNVSSATKTVKWDKTPPSGSVYISWNTTNDNLYLYVSNVNDTVSGVSHVYVTLTDKDNTTNKHTIQLTKSQYDNSWILPNTDVLSLFSDSFQVQAEVYATDNAGNTSLLKCQVLDMLNIFATVNINPAKQGQQLTFTINTVGNPVKLALTFPTAIGGTADIPIEKREVLTTLYQYTLPLDIPLTLDQQGNTLSAPHVFTFTATKANGKSASCTVLLDVQNNIYTGIRTRFRN